MKKFSLIFLTAILFSNQSFATGAFIGADILGGISHSKASNISTTSGSKDRANRTSSEFNYGLNAGFRLDILNLMGSAELFYDNLNLSSQKFDSPNNTGDSVKLKDRYGAKFNVGFAIFPLVRPFVTLGLANVRYNSNATPGNGALSKTEFAPLYGIGVLVDLPLGFTVKASLDHQQFSLNSTQPGAKTKTNLEVAKIGLIYNF